MEKNYKNLWDYIQSSWQKRAGFVFILLWLWFIIMAALVPSASSLYTYAYGARDVISVVSETEIFLYIFGMVLGVVGYIIGLVWVLKKCTKVYTKCHWVDLIIKRLGYGLVFLLVMGIATSLLWMVCAEFPIAAVVFSVICVISLVIAFIISGMFVRESLITEATIKAHEFYNGKKRSQFNKQ